ncbi:MAG: DUF309 domain-containing protein [Alphaproteobacteria bacterium]|nr:DUF309 domain-containing protein [Alphaproteobacteria bacterium]
MADSYDSRYTGFFACFNRQEYFEAHEVLEGLWLECKDGRRDFYKGLIQVAAVFVKLQQGKLEPAQRIAARATTHLTRYGPCFEGLTLPLVIGLLNSVRDGQNPLAIHGPPRLALETP